MLVLKPPVVTTTRILAGDPRFEVRGHFALFRDGIYRRVWRAYFGGAAIGELQGYTNLRALENELLDYIVEARL